MTRVTLRDHPQFPYRAETRERIDSWRSSFLDGPTDGSPMAGVLLEFIEKTQAFAFLERVLGGDVRYQLPVHRDVIQETGGAPESRGEALAASELAVMGYTDFPASELEERLDAMGIKVFTTTREGDLVDPGGACFFEGELGPSLLVAADPGSPTASYVLAHEFGHLVADVNPYRPRFCTWDPESLTSRVDSPEELRADRFARAHLMPAALIRRSLLEMGGECRVDVLATLFAVPEVVAYTRLRELGLGVPAAPPARTPRMSAGESQVTSGRLSLPQRFVQLAVGAWAARLMGWDLLALFLGMDAAGTRELIDWMGITRQTTPPEDSN